MKYMSSMQKHLKRSGFFKDVKKNKDNCWKSLPIYKGGLKNIAKFYIAQVEED